MQSVTRPTYTWVPSDMTTRILRAIAALLVLGACSTSTQPPAEARDDRVGETAQWSLGPEREAEFAAAYPYRHYSGVDSAVRTVIRTSAEWSALWASLSRNGPFDPGPPPVPAVDFSREMVVFVAMGVRSSGGHTIDIVRVERLGDVIEVEVKSTSPGPNCVTTAALTQPTHALVVPRTADGVVFREAAPVEFDCG
jgi:hypothetical protein